MNSNFLPFVFYRFSNYDLFAREVRSVDLKADDKFAADDFAFCSVRSKCYLLVVECDDSVSCRRDDHGRNGLSIIEILSIFILDLNFTGDLVCLSGNQLIIGDLVDNDLIFCSECVLLASCLVICIRDHVGNGHGLSEVFNILMLCNKGLADIEFLKYDECFSCKVRSIKREGNDFTCVVLIGGKSLFSPYLFTIYKKGLACSFVHDNALEGVFLSYYKILVSNSIVDLGVFIGKYKVLFCLRTNSGRADFRETDSLCFVRDVCVRDRVTAFAGDRLKYDGRLATEVCTSLELEINSNGSVNGLGGKRFFCSYRIAVSVFDHSAGVPVPKFALEGVCLAYDQVFINNLVLKLYFCSRECGMGMRKRVGSRSPYVRGLGSVIYFKCI